MDRNAVAPDSAEGSFAGLLEHFTRRSRPETRNPEPGPNTASRTGSTTRSGARTLAPATELKAGRGTAIEDSTPLSYEQALRLHARRRTPANVNLDLPNMPLPAVSSLREAAPDPRQEPSKIAKARNNASASSTQEAAEQSRRKAAPKSSSPQSKVQASARPKKSSPPKTSPGRQRRADSLHPASRASTSLNSAKLSEAISDARRKPQPPSNARPVSGNRRSPLSHTASSRSAVKTTALESTAQPAQAKSLAKVEHRDMQWSPSGPLDALDRINQTVQKRTIVSLRMTDIEFLQLKDRAGESGVSVSAYMRSCILDADQLRTQVKQALAEMRALSAMPDPNRFPALAPPENSRQTSGGDWFGMLWRSAAFLLGPLFSFRRSA